MIDYKGYTGVFEFDPDLRLFTGHVVDLRDEIYYEGDSVQALESSMGRAIDHYLEVCKARGEEPERPFSGKLNVRLAQSYTGPLPSQPPQKGEPQRLARFASSRMQRET